MQLNDVPVGSACRLMLHVAGAGRRGSRSGADGSGVSLSGRSLRSSEGVDSKGRVKAVPGSVMFLPFLNITAVAKESIHLS